MCDKVEFIESYIKRGSDYQWCDNHGELVRCNDCKYAESVCDLIGIIQNDLVYCKKIRGTKEIDWYCADGKRKDGDNNESCV